MKLFDVDVRRAAIALPILSLVLSACVASAREDGVLEPLRNVNEEGMTLAMCGTVDDFEAPLPPEKDGVLAIDGRRWTVLAHATLDASDLLSPGEDICIRATMDLQSRIEQCAVSERSP